MSSGTLPSPGTLSKKRRLSLFPSQTHLPVRRQDRAEMQHLVGLILMSLCVFATFTAELFSLPPLYNVNSVCRAGQWQCTEEKCAAQCSLVGALQVTTFDKKRYGLQGGDCAFTAVEVRYENYYAIFTSIRVRVKQFHMCVCVCVVTSPLALFYVYLGFCGQEVGGERALWRVYRGRRKGRRRPWLSQGTVSHCSPHLSHHHSFW